MGGQPRGLLPSGTVTFLITDIEGSTRLLRALGPAAYAEVLGDYYALLDAAVAAQAGVVIDREGDGCLAAFPGAGAAVRAAVEAQQVLGARAWPGGDPLRVRMGLHSGEAEPIDGRYVSVVVHETARIGAAAAGGQALLSWSTSALLASGAGLPPGCALHPLGRFRLRDVPEPVALSSLRHAALANATTPPRAVPALPAAELRSRAPFVGRVEELHTLDSVLGMTRLLTLTGAGGSGKTRLAGELAAQVADAFPDGVLTVELAPLADPAAVARRIAAAVGIREESGRALLDDLAQALVTRRALLVLDNCEHLVDEVAGVVDRLLEDCSDLTVIATSREPLDVPGETVWPVPPLSLPGPGVPGLDCDAVSLFAERATAADPTFAVTKDNIAAVARICARLDGLPLALELAAARVRALPPEQLAERLDQRFELLTGGRRGSLPRHQTLRALVDWSHDLLDPDEQQALRRLSVFAGAFALDAAEAVAAGEDVPRDRVANLVAALVRKSLVMPVDAGMSRLLETVREYGRLRLREAGETAQAKDRHLAWLVTAATRRDGESDSAWYARQAGLLDELRLGFAWVREGARGQLGAELVVALGSGVWRDQHLTETRGWLTDLLAVEPGLPDSTRATVLGALCRLLWKTGDLSAAEATAERALALHDAAATAGDGGSEDATRLLLTLSSVAIHDDRLAEAESICRRLLNQGRSDYVRVGTHNNLGIALAGSGRPGEALESFALGLAHARETGQQELQAKCLVGTAFAYIEAGMPTAAGPCIREALGIDLERGDLDEASECLVYAAVIGLRMAEAATEALQLIAASLALLDGLAIELPPFYARRWYAWREEARRRLAPLDAASAESAGARLGLDASVELAGRLLQRVEQDAQGLVRTATRPAS